jgi:signal transduction histidine kinase
MAYLISDTDGNRLVVLMDNSAMDESKQILLHSTLLYSVVAVPLLALLSWLFAGWTLKPMRESIKKQRQFIADAGHELKTPVSTINANLELLSRDVGENRWLSNIQYENKRMEELVRQFLELAQLESVNLSMERIDFSRLVTAGILPFESKAFETGCTLEYNISDGVTIRGNRGQLAQLISILLDNALEHCCKEGKVSVSLTESHGKADLCVSNSGATIPENQIEHLFERFYRVEEARTTQEEHFGLGLSIAKAVTEAHFGKIYVKSEDRITNL